jgi:hypothetical protein
LAQAKKEKALKDAKKVEGVIVPLRRSGASLKTICEVLNASGARTARGCLYNQPLVSRMLFTLETHAKDKGLPPCNLANVSSNIKE